MTVHELINEGKCTKCNERDIPDRCRGCGERTTKHGGWHTPYICRSCGRIEMYWHNGGWWLTPPPAITKAKAEEELEKSMKKEDPQ